MKKKILCVILILAAAIAMVGCSNMQIMDTTYKFDRAIISMPDGNTVKGDVQGWKDWDDSDMVQVKINGRTYYTHGSNVVLIAEQP